MLGWWVDMKDVIEKIKWDWIKKSKTGFQGVFRSKGRHNKDLDENSTWTLTT